MWRWVWKTLQSLLFLFDAETAHRITVRLLRFSRLFGSYPVKIISQSQSEIKNKTHRTNVAGMTFRSPIGLAAGFDKNAEIISSINDCGFGFLEIGTVTPLPQPGNDRPRLFRSIENQNLFNRMGFNSDGASVVAERLKIYRNQGRSDDYFRIGVNIGKNKATSIENTPRDYVRSAAHFENLADYLVINVSSPNTPGLRDLQTDQTLRLIVTEVANLISNWAKTPPLFLKLAPDLNTDALKTIVQVAPEWGISGWVLTNTMPGIYEAKRKKTLSGGWSGSVLRESSMKSLVTVREFSSLPIMSVGGIMSARDVKDRLDAGANLVQLYSGWIFNGPTFPSDVLRSLHS